MTGNNNETRIAVLCDLHFSGANAESCRRMTIADTLLTKAVHRLNRVVRPDVTVLLGDLLDDGSGPGAAARRETLKDILAGLESPLIVIPGNHDGDPASFYKCFARPADTMDIAGVRFLPFIDRDEPGYNASRAAVDIERIRQARAGFAGPIVALQHVCLAPPALAASPYNFLNAAEITRAMKEAGVMLSLSGHLHTGLENISCDGTTYACIPALCEPPFRFGLVTVRDGRVSLETHQLAVPGGLRLFDWHVHTQFAYCARNMDVTQTLALAGDFGLAGVGFAEHSGQLYFNKDDYWQARCHRDGIGAAKEDDSRIEAYFKAMGRHAGRAVRVGMEIDCDYDGNPLASPRDAERCSYLIGAIHRMPTLDSGETDSDKIAREYAGLLSKFLQHGAIDILAHPFRILANAGIAATSGLQSTTADLLRRSGVAAEINFHGKGTSDEFVRMCLDMGVKLALSSDSHAPYEIGELVEHLELLRRIGFNGNLADIVFSLPDQAG